MTERISPLDPHEWADEVRALLGDARPDLGPADAPRERKGPPNIVFTLAHLPHLLAPFLGFASALATRGRLSRRNAEILALRASWNCRSAFEWGQHAEYARDAGLSGAEIAAVRAGPADPAWSVEERTLLQAADELHTHRCIGDQTWAALARRHSEAQLVEIPLVVGHYTMLSMVARSTGVPLEPGLPPLAHDREDEITRV